MVVLLIIIIFLLWGTGFLVVTDFSVPVKDAKRFHHILVLFPHADDEAITCGGFLKRLSKEGSAVTLVLLTKGEKGPQATRNGNLKELRTREAQAVATILGVSKLIQEDFGDGELCTKRQELAAFIATMIEREKPNLLITYDLAGFYGHADHITCSEIVTELRKTRFPEVALWYATFPQRILARIKVPDDLAINPSFREKQALPTHKLFIGTSVLPKIKAWYTYKSQRASLAKGINRGVPLWVLWFFLSMVLFEYFAEVR
jgi:LmbE family N-acetylglucosaminyl deacetylase